MSTNSTTAKQDLRREIRNRLKAMPEQDRSAASAALAAHVTRDLPAWNSARRVMLYVPMRSEPNIRPLVETLWTEGREVVLPWFPEVVETGSATVEPPLMCGRLVRGWNEVHPGLSGFSQPNETLCPVVLPDSLDLILIPGTGFDSRGGRLGRGRGDYDRFLPRTRRDVVLCGVCYDIQRLTGTADEPVLPLEPHDVPMHFVATDRGIFPCSA